MGGAVELATILLTDLVESTRLAMSIGPARADELREEHFALLRDAIAACGGSEVKNTGDGLMVAFPSASAAVTCAVGMQQRLERHYRHAELGLHVRIGIGAGESTIQDGDYFGMPTVEAARLCAQSPPDGVLASGAVKMLAGRCEGVEFELVGELELKGFTEPVPAFAVSWSPLADEAEASGRWPLPRLLRSVPQVSYVGREQERAALEGAITVARSGQRQLVLLSGEPGIGKTRLASYAAHRAHAQRMAVLWGGCSEELAVPYEPWIAVCSQIVEHAEPELLERHVARHGGELGRLVPNLAHRVPELPEPQSSDPETERYLLFSAVAGLLEDVAREIPLCVVFDDLHWADGQSVALLKHLVGPLDRGALQMIATYRDSELGKDHPLSTVLADLRRVEGVQRVALRGFGTAEVAELMAVLAGHELPDEGVALAAQIAAETNGNPFFVGEVLRSLSESPDAAAAAAGGMRSGEEPGPIVLPESVREVVERRVERLGRRAAEALCMGAVIGNTFELALLAAALDSEEDELLDQLEAAVAASLLGESSEHVGRFRFAHGLINQTLYGSLGTTRRAHMHRRVAEALEQQCGEDPGERLAELALHWRLAAVSVDKAKAARYARRAGERALRSLAPAEALRLFGEAVELSAELGDGERCEALIGLGEAERQSGHAAYRETLLEASRIAAEIGDAGLAASAALANNRGYSSVIGDLDRDRLAAIEAALELDDPPQPARRARLLALQAQELSWDADFARRRRLAEEAISLARRAGQPRTLVEVLSQASYALWSAETLELRAALADELASDVDALPDPALRFTVQYIELSTWIERGELARARSVLARMASSSEEFGQPTFKWFARFPAAAYELMCGDLETAERLGEQAFQLGQEAGESDALLIYGAQIGYIRTCQGRGGEIVELLEQSVAAYPAIAAWRAALTWALSWLGREDEARVILTQAAEDRFEHVQAGPARLTALALYADAACRSEAVEPGRILYELIEPWSGQVVWNSVTGCGHVRMWLGLLAALLGRHELADGHLAFACEFQEGSGMPLWATRAQIGIADALARRGETRRSQEHGRRALELARTHGYGLFEPDAARLAAAAPRTGA